MSSFTFERGEVREFDVMKGFDPEPGPGNLHDYFFASGTPAAETSAGRFIDSEGPVYTFQAGEVPSTYTFNFTIGWRGSTATQQYPVSIIVR